MTSNIHVPVQNFNNSAQTDTPNEKNKNKSKLKAQNLNQDQNTQIDQVSTAQGTYAERVHDEPQDSGFAMPAQQTSSLVQNPNVKTGQSNSQIHNIESDEEFENSNARSGTSSSKHQSTM